MTKIDIKDFVLSFVRGRNAEEAAVNAGISPARAKQDGLKLLSQRGIRRQVEKERDIAFSGEAEIRAGLERLAYGRVNDAAALAFADEVTPAMLAKADLFNVSEIKRIKGGGVEIKFYDRQKALERLCELNERDSADDRSRSMVEAIYGGAGLGDIAYGEGEASYDGEAEE